MASNRSFFQSAVSFVSKKYPAVSSRYHSKLRSISPLRQLPSIDLSTVKRIPFHPYTGYTPFFSSAVSGSTFVFCACLNLKNSTATWGNSA